MAGTTTPYSPPLGPYVETPPMILITDAAEPSLCFRRHAHHCCVSCLQASSFAGHLVCSLRRMLNSCSLSVYFPLVPLLHILFLPAFTLIVVLFEPPFSGAHWASKILPRRRLANS